MALLLGETRRRRSLEHSVHDWIKGAVRRLERAQILLATDAGPPKRPSRGTSGGTSTIYRTKQRFVEEGLERALSEAPRPGVPRKRRIPADRVGVLASPRRAVPVDDEAARGELIRLTAHESLSGETVRRRLAEMDLKPWQEKMCASLRSTPSSWARMEDVLDLYAEAPDPRPPVVCFDETPRQLIGEERVSGPCRTRQACSARLRIVRNGTANVFMFVDVNRPWRHAKVTDQRTCVDFTMQELVDVHCPEAEGIRVVLDDLSAHSAAGGPACVASRVPAFSPGRLWPERRPTRGLLGAPLGNGQILLWPGTSWPSSRSC